MMLTFRAGKLAALIVMLAVLDACSREQQDWRSAEASDTVAGYGEFLQRHPDSELATEARTRVAQLSEDLEWRSAGSADNADAYKQFLAQHPNGKWAQEARIRIENFALGREGAAGASGVSGAVGVPAGSASTAVASPRVAPASGSASGAALGSTSGPGAGSTLVASGVAVGSARALPGEAAQAYPGESARAQVSTQAFPGESARAPASAQAMSPGTAAIQSSAPPPASPAIATAWRSDDGFGIQLGAFASENAATNEWQQLTARFGAELHGLAPRVVSATTATGRLFRLQALVADEARARAICDMLKKQSQACVPVLPH